MTERHYAIVANVSGADSCLRLGARVVVCSIPGNPAHVVVRGLSRGGRAVTKWVASSRLSNLRPAWEHKPPPLSFETREGAEQCISARFG
jgi:hypothetical protein